MDETAAQRELADLRADVAYLIGRWGPGAATGKAGCVSALIAGLRRAIEQPGAGRPDSLLNLSGTVERDPVQAALDRGESVFDAVAHGQCEHYSIEFGRCTKNKHGEFVPHRFPGMAR